MNKLKNKTFIFFVLLGLVWIILHFLLRFVVQRFPYKIGMHIPKLTIGIAVILVCIHTSIVYLHLRRILNFQNKENFFTGYLTYLSEILYWRPLREFHDHILVKMPFFGNICEELCEQYLLKCPSKGRILFTLVVFNFLPRILVSLAFFIDVVIYQQVAYLYILLVLIAYPLIFDSILYILHTFASGNRDDLEKNIMVFADADGEEFVYLDRKTKTSLKDEALDFYSKYWLLFYEYDNFFTFVKDIKAFYLSYVLVFTSTLYLIGWSYYLRLVLSKIVILNFITYILAIYVKIEEPFSGVIM